MRVLGIDTALASEGDAISSSSSSGRIGSSGESYGDVGSVSGSSDVTSGGCIDGGSSGGSSSIDGKSCNDIVGVSSSSNNKKSFSTGDKNGNRNVIDNNSDNDDSNDNSKIKKIPLKSYMKKKVNFDYIFSRAITEERVILTTSRLVVLFYRCFDIYIFFTQLFYDIKHLLIL